MRRKQANKYRDYFVLYNRQANRWFSFKKVGKKRNYVASASSLEMLKEKLDKNPSPVMFGDIAANNITLLDPISLEEINKCRELNGFSHIKIKNRVCLKCKVEFLSIENRLCYSCRQTNNTVSDIGEYSICI